MASFFSLIRPKISLSRLSSILASSSHSLPVPEPAPLNLISRSFCTISQKAAFEDPTHLDPRYTYSADIPTLIEEIDSLRDRIGQVLLKGGSETVQALMGSYPEELLEKIDDVVFWNLFVKQGCRSVNNGSDDENNMYLRVEIPGVDRVGLNIRMYDVCNMDFVVYKKEVNFIGVADREADPEFGDLDFGREYIFQRDLPVDIDIDNSRYFVKKGVFWMVLPKFVR